MGPLVASTSRKRTTHSLARVESREFTVVVFPPSIFVNIFVFVRMEQLVGLLLRAKNFLTYMEYRPFYARLTTKEIFGNPLHSTLIYHH